MLEVRLVSVEPFRVIASRYVGPQPGLFEAYGALFRWGEEAGHTRNLRGIYGVPVDDPGTVDETECRVDCCFDFGTGAAPGNDYNALMLGGGLPPEEWETDVYIPVEQAR